MRHSLAFFAILFAPFLAAQSINLKDSDNQFDYVIISSQDLMNSCNNFKTHKEQLGYKVIIVSIDNVFAQFNAEDSKQDNLREFISYAGTFWKAPQPKYFLIVGDLSKIPNYEYVTLQNYKDTTQTDYFYAVNLNDPDTLTADFYVGRVAARNTTELNNYFNKVINYENSQSIQPWNMNSLIISDNGPTPSGNDGDIFERISFDLGDQFPSNIILKYFFESDTSSYYGNKDSILNFINNVGLGSVFFVGHNNDSIFTHEKLFTLDDIKLINNGDKYFFVNFLGKISFSNSSETSLIDGMLFKENGAVAGFNSTGVVYAFSGSEFIERYVNKLYSIQHYTLGEVENSVLNNSTENSKKQFSIFGDPSLRLKYDIVAGINGTISSIPEKFKLEQNYPNPFNPSTVIRFNLPKDDNIQLKVYDVLGNEVAALINGFYKAGRHEIKFTADGLSSGIYFYTLRGSNFKQTNKMVLIK